MRTTKIFRIGLFVIILLSMLAPLKLLIFGGKAVGKVVDIRESIRGRYSFPVIEFQTHGETVRFEGEANMVLEPGKTVVVVYSADDWQNAKVLSFTDLFTYPLIIMFTGLFIWYAFISSFNTIFDKPLIVNIRSTNSNIKGYSDLPHFLRYIFKGILIFFVLIILMVMVVLFMLYLDNGITLRYLLLTFVIVGALIFSIIREFLKI